MAMDIITRALAAGAIRIAMGHEFATDAERDAYFVANPNELIENMYIRVGDKIQQYVAGQWIDVTVAIKGDKGDKGDKGNDALINGVNSVEITPGDNIEIEQVGNTLIISGTDAGIIYQAGHNISIEGDTISALDEVYVGNEEPTEESIKVWIDLDSEEEIVVATQSDLENLATINGKSLLDGGDIKIEGQGQSYSNDVPTTVSVGDIKAGYVFQNVDLTKLIEDIFFGVKNPTLTNPSSTITLNSSRLVEVGVATDIRITTNFSRGSISPSYGTSGFRSGLATQYLYTGGGLGTINNTSNQDIQTINNYTFNEATQMTISSRVSYSAGEQPKNSKGENYGSPLVAGNTSSKSVTIVATYPIFATTENIGTMTRQPLTDSKQLDYFLVSETPTQKQAFQWDATLGSLDGAKQYNILSKQFEWIGGSQENSIKLFNVEDVTVELASGSRMYKKYTYNGAQIGGRDLQIFIS